MTSTPRHPPGPPRRSELPGSSRPAESSPRGPQRPPTRECTSPVDEIVVRGRRTDHEGLRVYVLDRRLTGHDSYRTARLRLAGGSPTAAQTAGGPPARPARPNPSSTIRVRVLTFDEVTVVWPTEGTLPDRWDGTLVVPRAAREPAVPPDLAFALVRAGLDPGALAESAGRHLAGFVAEARHGAVRAARVAVAVAALSQASAGGACPVSPRLTTWL